MTGAAERTPRRNGGRGGARQSAARLLAVQALYQIEQSAAVPDEVLEEFLRFRLDDSFDVEAPVAPNKNLFSMIVQGVAARQAEIDDMVSAALSDDWPLARIEMVLRAILRAGTFELLGRADTPARVIISEYVDTAHAFYEGSEPGMVNGILDRIARTLRPAELAARGRSGDGDR